MNQDFQDSTEGDPPVRISVSAPFPKLGCVLVLAVAAASLGSGALLGSPWPAIFGFGLGSWGLGEWHQLSAGYYGFATYQEGFGLKVFGAGMIAGSILYATFSALSSL